MAYERERIDVTYDYALCTWAKLFNVSEKQVKEAVEAVGDRADRVREHLSRGGSAHADRPSSH